ncbi:MAG: cytochrome c oxidase subunit II [Nitrosospira sp.]|nr:cytochrome c oxidase subunit II [Nitrosospira sp.]
MSKGLLRTIAGAGLVLLAGCNPQQSAFAPAGVEAERINVLFWVMTIAGGLIFAGVIVLCVLAIYAGDTLRSRLSGERLITGAGIVFPIVVLSVLLVYGFVVLRAGAGAPPSDDGIRFAISGEQWWWRVTYFDADGNRFESANELHIPVGRSVRLELTTADVLHSFWVPRLAGKLDMIPGRTNVLTVTATEEGISRGQCAEYCGGAHALMAFYVVAQTPEDFKAWLAKASGPAVKIEGEHAAHGAQLFLDAGCGACHTIRGTPAHGVIGPDLTHVGSRLSLAAGVLPNTAEAFARWVANNQHIKPENKMPPYNIFTRSELEDLALYLESLK